MRVTSLEALGHALAAGVTPEISFDRFNIGKFDLDTNSLCTNMKTAGVTVYTIGFELPSSTARDVMRNCATDTSKFYDAANGEALRQAFRDIALQLAKLRLSQ